MQVVFRVDASIQIGTGHVMRCLTMADKLRRNGASVQFVCREHPGHLCGLIEQHGFNVYRLPSSPQTYNLANGSQSYEYWLGETWETDAFQTSNILRSIEASIDLMIIDHYSIDIRWEQSVRRFVKKLMIIDDLANRLHDCDIILDQNLYENMQVRYDDIVPKQCLTLLGPGYALLREEFQNLRSYASVRSGTVQNIFVFFGGSDPTNETAKALEAIASLNRSNIMINVVVGHTNLNKDHIAALCSQMPDTHYHCQIDYMGQLMMKADLAIGAGGSTTWERCALGLPAVTITTADNQIEMTRAVAKVGANLYLGHYTDISAETMADALKQLIQSPQLIIKMSAMSMEIMRSTKAEDNTDLIDVLLARSNVSENNGL